MGGAEEGEEHEEVRKAEEGAGGGAWSRGRGRGAKGRETRREGMEDGGEGQHRAEDEPGGWKQKDRGEEQQQRGQRRGETPEGPGHPPLFQSPWHIFRSRQVRAGFLRVPSGLRMFSICWLRLLRVVSTSRSRSLITLASSAR